MRLFLSSPSPFSLSLYHLPHQQEAHITQHLLWKLFHIEASLTKAAALIEEESEKIPHLRTKVTDKETDVEKMRKELAEVNKNVLKMEKNIRRKERDVEEKVSLAKFFNMLEE